MVHFGGDANDDGLQLFVEGGFLRYTGATPDAATLNILVADVRELAIDLGGGTDLVRFSGDAPLALVNGRIVVANVESIRLSQSIAIGGDFLLQRGGVLVDEAAVSINAGGAVLIAGTIDTFVAPMPVELGPSALVAPPGSAFTGRDFLAWQRNVGRTSEASWATGDFDGDGDADAVDLAVWKASALPEALPAAMSPELRAVCGQGVLTWQRFVGTAIGATLAEGDWDGDGDVDRADLTRLGSHFGDELATAVDGAAGLSITAGGAVTLEGAIGQSVPLGSLMVDGAQIVLSCGNISLDGNTLTFNSPVLLAAPTVIMDSGDVTFMDTVDGAFLLRVETPGVTRFNGVVGGITALATLETDADGQTQLNGNVTTTGAQMYGDNVRIDSPIVLTTTNSAVSFAGTVDSEANEDNDLRIEAGSGNVTFTGAVGSMADGELGALIVNSTGLTQFAGNVEAASVTTNLGGETRFGAAAGPVDIQTTGDQSYGDAVVLTGNVVLEGANITFGGTVNGAFSLTVNSPGITRFNAAVGGTIALTSLTTNLGGQTQLNANVSTTGAQNFGDNVRIDSPITLTTTNTAVSFGGTVDSQSGEANALTINAGMGDVTFSGTVGSAGGGALGAVLVNSTGTTRFNMTVQAASVTSNTGGQTQLNGNVTTTGAQTYGDTVRIDNPITLTTTVNGAVAFGGAVDSQATEANALTVSTSSGDVTFTGAVGSASGGALDPVNVNSTGTTRFNMTVLAASVTTNPGGQTQLNGNVTTTGAQMYGDNVRIDSPIVLTTTNSAVSFAGTVDSEANEDNGLRIESGSGPVTFGGAVGSLADGELGALVVNSTGATQLDGTVRAASVATNFGGETTFNIAATGVDVLTTGDQTYGDTIILMQHNELAGANISFARTIDSDPLGPWDLTVDASGSASFGGAIGLIRPLRNLTVRTGGAASGPLTIGVPITVAGNIGILVRESAPAAATDDLRLLGTAQLNAGGNVTLQAGDDITYENLAGVNAGNTLTIDGDFGNNDAFPTSIVMTNASNVLPPASGLLRGLVATIIHGGPDNTDVFLLQAERLSTSGSVTVRGYLSDAAASGDDDFNLWFGTNFSLMVNQFNVNGGSEVSSGDLFTIDHTHDTTGRSVEAQYTTNLATVPRPAIVDGSAARFTGYGTTAGFITSGVNRYFLKAAAAADDHLEIRANNLSIPVPVPPQSDPFFQIEQHIFVGNDGSDQWRLQGWDSAQLAGSNIRDVIVNNTNLPMLIEGGAGNDTLVGGSNVDVTFSGAGATVTDGATRFFNVGAADAGVGGAVIAGDVLVGGGGNDFLFADVDLFRDGDRLWGLVTPDVDSPFLEGDIIDGAGRAALALGEKNHAAQLGARDKVRNITGMLIDGGGVKNVYTWLQATPITIGLTDDFTSANLDMLINLAFRGTDAGLGKVGLLTLTGVPLDSFDIAEMDRPAPAAPVVVATSQPSIGKTTTSQTKATTAASPSTSTSPKASSPMLIGKVGKALSAKSVDDAFASWGI